MELAPPSFNRWQALTPESVRAAPAVPGVVQVRVAPLLPYPRGRSAMVWYGASDNIQDLLKQTFSPLTTQWSEEELRWRFRLSAHPHRDFERTLQRFQRRFGDVPRANAAGLDS